MNWSDFDSTAVILVLILHLAWILWVIFGAFWTAGRRWPTAVHIASLLWGITVEIGPWPCPLTTAEDFFQRQAGFAPFRGSFLLHYIQSLVYPNVSVTLLTICGVAVCASNLCIYGWRAFQWGRRDRELPNGP
ncbi:MAG: DUF2784 domain-containing protein [Acidobacteriaceae bacterium]